MAVTTETSKDGKFSRNENNPVGTWTCKTCFALVMTGNRAGHAKRHDAEAVPPSAPPTYTGFGS